MTFDQTFSHHHELQEQLLEQFATGVDISATLDSMCLFLEEVIGDARASVMLLNKAGVLHVISAPSLDAVAFDALNGIVASDSAGFCGTSVHTSEPVIVEDTSTDQRWGSLREFAEQFQIHACWSIPIAWSNKVVGSFAVSRSIPGPPPAEVFALLRSAGHLAGLSLARDHAERGSREQRDLLQAVLESTEDPIFVKDLDGKYLLVNGAEVKGICDRPEQMVGGKDEDFYPADVAARMIETDHEVIREGRSRTYEDTIDNTHHGSRTYLIRKSPILDSDGSPRGIVGIARDISDLKRTAEALRRTQKLESLGVLAGGIAHDFNNLLTGILGNTEIALAELEPNSKARPFIEDVRRASRRAAELTDQMLAYSGRSEFVRSPVAMPELVREVKILAGPGLRHATVLFDIEADLPLVFGDATQLRQIAMNLLINASDSLTQDGQIVVKLRACRRAGISDMAFGADALADQYYVEFSISDNGVGMDDETLERIFDPFYTTKEFGRGLGLAATQGIIRAHGGAIDVSSRVGHGTAFRVYLPVAGDVDKDTSIAREVDESAVSTTVLVVDDEETVRILAERVLERDGYVVHAAKDGEEGLRIADREANKIDVVLLDLTMPGISGDEVIRRLEKSHPELPVILMSGYGERDASINIEALGIASFLKKPFRPAALIRHIVEAIEGAKRV
ncbi:MAG: two-component system cell cycle sensor histidine kinase/response regulator CckA [Planctomycetota bacterium]